MCARGSSICSCLCSCLQATEKEKTRFSLLFFFGDWKTKKTPKKMASSMRRIPPTQGKGGVTGRPKGGDRNWNPAGASGSQAWTQGGHGRGEWYQHRGSDPSVVPPPPGLTPRYGESWPHRPTRPSFTPRGERDTDRRQSHREPRRRGSDDRTRRPERKPSARRSKEGHRTRSRRYQDRKNKHEAKKRKKKASRTDSTSSSSEKARTVSSTSKRTTYTEKMGALKPPIQHPNLMGIDKKAFSQRLKESPDFVNVVHQFIQDEYMTRRVNRGEFECPDENCPHVLSWAVPWTVPEARLRERSWYTLEGQKAAVAMFTAMNNYLQFFKPIEGQSLQEQVPALGGRGGCLD